MLGGEMSSDDLQESALIAWNSCEEYAPEKEDIAEKRSIHVLDPIKY